MKTTVVCYGQVQEFASRKAAMAYFSEGMMECDGHESERYCNVVMSLQAGEKIGWDFEEVPEGYGNVLNEEMIDRVCTALI